MKAAFRKNIQCLRQAREAHPVRAKPNATADCLPSLSVFNSTTTTTKSCKTFYYALRCKSFFFLYHFLRLILLSLVAASSDYISNWPISVLEEGKRVAKKNDLKWNLAGKNIFKNWRENIFKIEFAFKMGRNSIYERNTPLNPHSMNLDSTETCKLHSH